ncbi:hypothetical protein AVEN_210658-1 [Araneus ventricosus]|uniref:Uncharacterized protein n=1 Tax=Araneus ventricosus TaxID=182803 RepID=A0A4Y2F971_ARAVE|nr:hypothetical protein AVEN_210658-1 [Araneus ventricosus]
MRRGKKKHVVLPSLARTTPMVKKGLFSPCWRDPFFLRQQETQSSKKRRKRFLSFSGAQFEWLESVTILVSLLVRERDLQSQEGDNKTFRINARGNRVALGLLLLNRENHLRLYKMRASAEKVSIQA